MFSHFQRVLNAAGHNGIGLEDVITFFFNHGFQFCFPVGMDFTAGDGNLAVSGQFCQALVIIHGQRLFQPGNAHFSTGISKAMEARLKLAAVVTELGHKGPIPTADVSTKSKAQAYIGLDMDKLVEEKKAFLENLLPEWQKEARQREDAMPQYDLKVNKVSLK